MYNNTDLISKVIAETATKNAVNCHSWQPYCYLTPLAEEPPWISTYTLYFKKPELLAYISAADSMGLSLLLFMQLPLKSNPMSLKVLARKRSLTWNSHSRAFILQLITSWHGIAYHHIIMMALSLKFPQK